MQRRLALRRSTSCVRSGGETLRQRRELRLGGLADEAEQGRAPSMPEAWPLVGVIRACVSRHMISIRLKFFDTILVQYFINVKPLCVCIPRPDEVMIVRYVQPLTDEQRQLLEKTMKEIPHFELEAAPIVCCCVPPARPSRSC